MASFNVEQPVDSQLIEAQAKIWNHMFNFVNTVALKSALQLGIPDVIHNHGHQPMTLAELVEALSVNATKSQGIYRLMRLLIHSGFFTTEKIFRDGIEHEEEGYLLTPASRLLLQNEPLSLRSMILSVHDPVFSKQWLHVTDWLQNDDVTAFKTAYGHTVHEHARVTKFGDHFFEADRTDARWVTSVLFGEFKGLFEGVNCLVDVGCGKGAVAKAIAEAFPDIKCIAFDLPPVVAGLETSKNLSSVGGDMFQAIPPADALFFKWIFTDWNVEDCLRILKKCKEAIPGKEKGGKVIIVDIILPNEKGDNKLGEMQLFYDMFIMTLAMGKVKTERELEKLFFDAGFSDYKITPILGFRFLIEAYP